MEEPENEEEEKKGGDDEMFPDDEDDDKRSYQSEEAMKPEVPVRQPTTEELAKKDEAKMQKLSNEIKDKFGMQEFDIEIKKINDGQQNKWERLISKYSFFIFEVKIIIIIRKMQSKEKQQTMMSQTPGAGI